MNNGLEIRYPDVVAAPRSHWATQAPSSPFPAFDGSTQVDVAIVGAGYLGLWTALLLKRKAPHLKIAVLEAQRIADGPSGRNAGMAEGFWGKLPLLEAAFGIEPALEIAAAGEECANAIHTLAQAHPSIEAEDGPLGFLASHDWQRDGVATKFSAIERLTDERHAARADSQVLADLFPSNRFVDGILYPTAFTVQPAALVYALALEAVKLGVDIYERSPVLLARLGTEADLSVRAGNIKARHFVQATGAWTGSLAHFSSHLTNFSSHICLSEPIANLEAVAWSSQKPFYDARPFINYLRITGDRRIVVGSGSGEPSFRNRVKLSDFVNPGAWNRARAAFAMFVAVSQDIAFDSCWGGPIDISSDRIPFVGCFPGTRHYFGAGQSGHGIIPSCVMAHCITSTLLSEDDRWSRLGLNRSLPNKRFPPEPLRYAGGRLVQKAALRWAADLDSGRKGRALDRLLLGLPKVVGLDLGLR